MKKSDDILQKEVTEAIKWEPLKHSDEIDIKTQRGTVIPGGVLEKYAQKREAARAIRNIAAVKNMNEIKADLYSSAILSDNEITSLVIRLLKENRIIPSHKIKVAVKKGWITLKGILHCDFQKEAVDNTVRNIKGVRGVIDKIKIETQLQNEINQEIIEKALRQNWLLEIDNIKVRVKGKTVFLTGTVESLFQKEEAERIACNTPGVFYVANKLLVECD
jgi:osmotically-inducible protein OsmY